jgi:type II secretion system protein I
VKRRAPSETGFSMVETLVAIAIVSGALGMTMQVITTSARQTKAVEDRRLAMLVAQSQLAAVGAAQNSRFGETQGLSNGVRWRITVKPYPSGVNSPVRLEEVTVTTAIDEKGVASKRDLFTLRTLRVAR